MSGSRVDTNNHTSKSVIARGSDSTGCGMCTEPIFLQKKAICPIQWFLLKNRQSGVSRGHKWNKDIQFALPYRCQALSPRRFYQFNHKSLFPWSHQIPYWSVTTGEAALATPGHQTPLLLDGHTCNIPQLYPHNLLQRYAIWYLIIHLTCTCYRMIQYWWTDLFTKGLSWSNVQRNLEYNSERCIFFV